MNFKIYIREKNENVHVIYYIYGTFITFGTLHDVNVIFEAIKECVLLDKLCQTIHVTINYGFAYIYVP